MKKESGKEKSSERNERFNFYLKNLVLIVEEKTETIRIKDNLEKLKAENEKEYKLKYGNENILLESLKTRLTGLLESEKYYSGKLEKGFME